jgi:hypothetical protein
MDHDAVAGQKMTERYLLNELDPEVRDEFEEHYFDCPECAQDMRAGSEFVEQSKRVLAERSEQTPVVKTARGSDPFGSRWFAWLRPQLAAPLLALLLVVVGYQNLVMYPKLQAALVQPRVLPWVSVAVGTWGGATPSITVHQGSSFLMFVRIPPDGTYTKYTTDLYNPSGKVEWSLTFPANLGQDQWPVQVPGANRESGSYKIAVRGFTAAGESKNVGSVSFELQIQK